jgi:tripartite-type tricarboxylate transporter receptor subunit TctC
MRFLHHEDRTEGVGAPIGHPLLPGAGTMDIGSNKCSTAGKPGGKRRKQASPYRIRKNRSTRLISHIIIIERRRTMLCKWSRRGFLFILVGMFSICSQGVLAQEYPTKPVALVIPSPAGGASDLTFRAVTSVAADYLGQPVLNQLKPGGIGAIGSDFVAKARPDGYTLLAGALGWSTSLPAIEGRSKGPEDLVAVCRINYNATIICAKPDAPFKTWKQLIAWAKGNPGKLTVGTPGPWSPPDMAWKLIIKQTGINVRLVPFDGGGAMFVALLGGHTDVGHARPIQYYPYKGTGKLVPLLFLDEKRHRDLPDVPTGIEEGFTAQVNMVSRPWAGVLAPKGTPRPIIDKLALAFKKMTEDSTVVAMLKQFGDDVSYLGPDEFEKYWREEFELYRELGKEFKK